MIVSDNGSNMIKALWLLNDRQLHEDYECAVVGEEPSPDDDGKQNAENDADCENELFEATVATEDEVDDCDTDAYPEPDIEQIELVDLQNNVPYQRLMCIAHTLQLVIRKAYSHYDNLLIKVCWLTGKVEKSSIAVGKLKKKTDFCSSIWPQHSME